MRGWDQRLAGLIGYPFPLSGDEFAYIYLPRKLRRNDAERIKRALDALVLDEEQPADRLRRSDPAAPSTVDDPDREAES